MASAVSTATATVAASAGLKPSARCTTAPAELAIRTIHAATNMAPRRIGSPARRAWPAAAIRLAPISPTASPRASAKPRYLCLWEAPRAPSRLRRNERIGHPLRRDRMPGLAREHQDRLDVEPPERPPPLVDPRPVIGLLPHEPRTPAAQVVEVDPGREPGITVRQHMRPVGRVDREVVHSEFGAAGIDDRRPVGFVP